MLTVTQAALDALKPYRNVRVGVRGGGCSGYEYVLEPCEPNEAWTEIYPGVWLDDMSAMYLDEATLDFQTEDFVSGFKFSNPNQHTCGCGKSFSA